MNNNTQYLQGTFAMKELLHLLSFHLVYFKYNFTSLLKRHFIQILKKIGNSAYF